MLRTLAVLIVGLSLSAVAWKLHRQDRELAALRSQIATLSLEEPPADTKPVCPIVCAGAPPAPPPSLAVPAPEARGSAPLPAPAEPAPSPEPISPEEQQANLASAFGAETADPAWSGQESKRWVAVMGDLGLSSTEIAGVGCRRSLCRAQIVLSTGARYDAFFKTAIASPALRSAGVQSTFLREAPKPDGRVPVTMYFSRAGTTLPLLD
jgi:hypothetical protein